jgi:uncharacterized protein YaaN involved in tellurite resistance
MSDIVPMSNEESNEEVPQIVNLEDLSPTERQQAEAIANQMEIDDPNAVTQFGVGAQKKVAGFADTILGEIRSKDAGYVGDTLTNLVVSIKEVGVDKITEKGYSKGVPILKRLVRAVRKFTARYNKMSTTIEKITSELEKARMNLLKDITMLENLFKKNEEYLGELDIYIAAGQIKLEEAKKKILPELKQKADETNDPTDVQRLQDFAQFINRFEKKLHDLKLSRMVSLQTGPQIRLIQNNNQTLVEKIQSSIMTTIPLWKNQIVIAISLFRQQKALEVQRQVTDTTNELLKKNAEMLKEGTVETAKESERGIIEIETLQKVNADLISSIEETLRIQEEGRTKRQQAEAELKQMEEELKTKLKEVESNSL